MKTKTSKELKIEQPFEFTAGEIYLLNDDVEFDNGFEIITYKCGTPVKFIRKDSEKIATVMDSDKETFSVSINSLNKYSSDKLFKKKEQLKFNLVYRNPFVFFILKFLIFVSIGIAASYLFFKIELLLLVGILFFIIGLVLNILMWVALSVTAVTYDEKTILTMISFYFERKQNMRELKKLKGVNDTPHKNFTEK